MSASRLVPYVFYVFLRKQVFHRLDAIVAMRDIRASTSTPICCGENIYMRWGFREILEKRAADIIMPDFQKTGGLLKARKIADMRMLITCQWRRTPSLRPSE
jgi:L-alanine-DL-glutamate epimerase-like enolase superfamily enzyme